MVWKLHSFWDGLFSGALLVSGSVVSFEQICWQNLCDFCKYQPLGCESQSIILRLSTVPAVFILRIGGLFARSYNDPWFFVSCDKLDYVPFPDFCGKRRFRQGLGLDSPKLKDVNDKSWCWLLLLGRVPTQVTRSIFDEDIRLCWKVCWVWTHECLAQHKKTMN